MARRMEFKPDRPQGGLLSKLYLTKKQRLSLLKWGLYALVLLALSVLQDVALCHMDIFGATTELVPCGIFLICILEGGETGSVFALVASCIYVFSGSAAGTYSIVLLTAISIAATLFRQSYLQKGFGAAMLCAGFSLLAYEMSVFLMGIFLELTYWGRAGVFCITAALTFLAAPVLYPVLHSIGAIGGEAWKE